jgi:2,4-dienoyl-CoA reductase-like NADH-dependent reductase (Old Yellow Enzyme family)
MFPMTTLWDPITVGAAERPHRFAMAPMTRSRAKPDGTPGDPAAQSYAQRASMGPADHRRHAAVG